VLASPQVRQQLSHASRGTVSSMRNISQVALRAIRIPVATDRQQREAVTWLRPIRDALSRLERQLTGIADKEHALRETLLIDAFAGRLVEQSPNGEPASLLLKRIRAERVVRTPVKRRRRSRTDERGQGTLF
jgi:type I restriction enzyme S subunit